MKEICVQLGCSSLDPEKHCFDGDSSYVTGSVENVLVRSQWNLSKGENRCDCPFDNINTHRWGDVDRSGITSGTL